MSYQFEDCLDDKGSVSRAKLANCTFARLRPGDYVCASFGSYDEDNSYHHGCVYARVISVKQPKPTGFFSGSTGGVLAELPDGSRVEFLRYYVSGYSWNHRAYYPSGQVEQYFAKSCFPDLAGGVSRNSVFAIPADQRAVLKDGMTAEQERRKRRQEELNRQTKDRQRQADAARAQVARRAAEEARRNAAVSDQELDNLFRGR